MILRKIINTFSMLMIAAFIIALILESVALIAGVPIVVDNIEHPRISTESDLILNGNGSFSISPQVNGTSYLVEGHTIFVPEQPFEDGRIYRLVNEGKSMDFMAVAPNKLKYHIIGGFKEHIVIAFNMPVNRSALNYAISFEPDTNFSVTWHHNTVVISPDNSRFSYTMTIKGNISADDRNRTVDITVKYISGLGVGNSFVEPSSFPSIPRTYTFIIIPPGIPMLTGFLSGTSFLIYYLTIVATIAISLAYLGFRYGKQTLKSMVRFPKRLEFRLFGNAIFEIAALFFASLSFTVIFYMIAEIFNPHPTVPGISSMSLWEQLYGLARASVWEEVITRIPFIGIPLFFVHFYRNKGMKPLYSYIIGGNLGIDFASVSLITICGFMFGFVHMLGGWDAFKILPAMVGGMAMGYLFVRYGIWASITLHFATDYLSMPSALWKSDAINMYTELFILGALVVGVYFLYVYSKGIVERFFFPEKKKEKVEVKIAPLATYEPAHFESNVEGIPYAPYPYRCYNCGNTEAEYLGNGILRCTRCGSLSKLVPLAKDEGKRWN